MSAATITSPLVGRTEELAVLRRAVGRAAGGDPRIVLIEGDAGIGKSRLIGELLVELGEQGILTLTGSCPPIGGSELPLAPLAQALRALTRSLSPDDLAATLGPSRAAIAHLVPALASAEVAPDSPEPSVSLIFEHVLAVLERLSERHGPVVLVLEDLHWAAPSVWDLLAYLARNLQVVRVAIIATYRRGGLAPGGRADALLVELQRSATVDAVALPLLSSDEVTELVSNLTGATTSDTTMETLVRRAEGNPFFVEELTAAGAMDGAFVPDSLRTTLLARIGAQPEDVQQLARLAAVIGRRVPAEILIETSGAPDDVVVPLLRGAVSAGILEHVRDETRESYVFRQGLMRDVIYADLVPGERSRLHGAVARVLAAHPELAPTTLEHAIEVATHWRESGDLIRGVPALLKAAQAAEGVYAFSEAHALFEQAFALAARLQPTTVERRPIGFRTESRAPGKEWPDLLARAAEAASLAGEPRIAVERIEAALAQTPVGQQPERLRWSARRARYLLEAGRSEDGLAAYEDAVRHADDSPAAERARVLVAHARALVATAQYDGGREMAERALVAARSGGHRAVEWQALNVLGTALSLRGDRTRALDVLTTAHQLSGEHSSPSMVRPRPSGIGDLLGGYFDAARTLDLTGRREEAVAAAFEGVQAAKKYGSDAWRDRIGLDAATRFCRLGRWEEARALVEETRSRGIGRAGSGALAVGALLAAALGDWDEARVDVDVADVLLDPNLEADVRSGLYLAIAEHAFWRRQLREGAEAIVTGLAAASAEENRTSRVELCLAGVRLEAELVDEARLRRAPVELADHSEAAARYTAEIGAILGDVEDDETRPSAIVLTAHAELSRVSGSSPDAWETAALAWEREKEPYRAAYAGWRLAEAQLLSGVGRDRATERLRSAWITAQQLRAQPLASEISALATRARIELAPTKRDASPAAAQDPAKQLGLSTRELEVLAVLAQGLTNRQIAGKLFITEKTAANHVSNILSKLGVSNRLEAAGIAYRVGLVTPADDTRI